MLNRKAEELQCMNNNFEFQRRRLRFLSIVADFSPPPFLRTFRRLKLGLLYAGVTNTPVRFAQPLFSENLTC
jgi:hypothetical protein